jgi:hypothetical protein
MHSEDAVVYMQHIRRPGATCRWVVSTTPHTLYPRERPSTQRTGSWVSLVAVLVEHGKSRPHRNSIPGPSSPLPVAILNTLSRPPGVEKPVADTLNQQCDRFAKGYPVAEQPTHHKKTACFEVNWRRLWILHKILRG